MKKILSAVSSLAIVAGALVFATPAMAAAPNWNVTGSYVAAFNYLSTDYPHDVSLTQDASGNLTGSGGSPAGANVYTWEITSGTVSGNTIDFYANYTATADAVTPLTVMHVTGTVAADGSMSGTWSDNYQGGNRSGTWSTTSGKAVLLGSLAAEDFGVVNYDAGGGLGILKGYTAGFGVTDATLAGATSVVVSLYGAGNQLLQTNTAILPKFNSDITGTQFSSPFDVSGTFNYVTDGYWTNVRAAEYGQSVPAVKVVANVTLANGKVVTAENDILMGDPTTIFPIVATSTTVHIFKYIDGEQATAQSANGVNFPMFTSTYNAPFTLGPAGWTAGDIAYEASTAPMPLGSSYSANENTSTTLVGASCTAGVTYSLVGYTTGDTLLAAQQAVATMSIPSFTNLQGDKYIIVWNHFCTQAPLIKVHIVKYLDGIQATSANVLNGYQFPMTATWTTANLNGGSQASGNYTLGSGWGGAASLYSADTAPMQAPADYTTSEVTASTSPVVSSQNQCAPGKYLLNGYRTSAVSFAAAAAAPLVASAPVFAGLVSDQYVIVDNSSCPAAVTTGSISGMKYNDLNRNGKHDANEPGLANWVIRLISGHTVVSTTTDANGNYTFSNVAPGTYKVREVHQNGWNRMSKNPKAIVITAGSVVTDVTFGNATKLKFERQDNNNDDNRDDQSGNYFAHYGKSDYGREQDTKGHSQR